MALAVEWLPEEWPDGIPNLKQLLVVAPLTTPILLLFTAGITSFAAPGQFSAHLCSFRCRGTIHRALLPPCAPRRANELTPAPTDTQKLKERLDILEAERLVLTIELRNALIRAAKDLLPRAIAQGKARLPARASPPAQSARKEIRMRSVRRSGQRADSPLKDTAPTNRL
jgi:hypothetical protein